MEDIFIEIVKTPLPTILVISGILFLFLAVVEKFGARIVVNPQKQRLAGLLGAILLVGGVALYVLQAPSTPTPASTSIPTSASTEMLTSEFWASRYWEFRHGEGDVISPRVKLHSNGTIVGIDHPNESTWGLEDDTLVFYHVSGVPSTRFTSVRQEYGKTIASGHLLLPGHKSVVIHVLEEL